MYVTVGVWCVCVYGRLVLRCRQDARARFAKMRSDVLVKLELLDNKHGPVSLINPLKPNSSNCYTMP